MISGRKRQRGFSILCLLMSLVILGVLTEQYMGVTTPGGKPWAMVQQDRTREIVTMVNTRTAQTEYFMRTEGRRPDPPTLRRHMQDLSTRMGGGGRFFVDHRENLQNTLTLETPSFSSQFQAPRLR